MHLIYKHHVNMTCPVPFDVSDAGFLQRVKWFQRYCQRCFSMLPCWGYLSVSNCLEKNNKIFHIDSFYCFTARTIWLTSQRLLHSQNPCLSALKFAWCECTDCKNISIYFCHLFTERNYHPRDGTRHWLPARADKTRQKRIRHHQLCQHPVRCRVQLQTILH